MEITNIKIDVEFNNIDELHSYLKKGRYAYYVSQMGYDEKTYKIYLNNDKIVLLDKNDTEVTEDMLSAVYGVVGGNGKDIKYITDFFTECDKSVEEDIKGLFYTLVSTYGIDDELYVFDICADYGIELGGSTIDKIEVNINGDIYLYYNMNTNDYAPIECFKTEDLRKFYNGIIQHSRALTNCQ